MPDYRASNHAIAEAFQPRSRYDLIAMAASAGGLPALLRILAALPATLDVPIVIVLHRTASSPQILPTILRRRSALPVKLAEQGELLEANHVYVAPADSHLVVLPDRTLHLRDGRRIKHVLSSANPLFESAATVLKSRVIAVVLTGSGTDATDGVQAVKGEGGIVIVQNPAEAAHPGMPTSAIQSGAVDYIVPLDEIAPLLLRLTGQRDDSSSHGAETDSSPRRTE